MQALREGFQQGVPGSCFFDFSTMMELMQLCGVQGYWTIQKLAECVKCILGYTTQWWHAQ